MVVFGAQSSLPSSEIRSAKRHFILILHIHKQIIIINNKSICFIFEVMRNDHIDTNGWLGTPRPNSDLLQLIFMLTYYSIVLIKWNCNKEVSIETIKQNLRLAISSLKKLSADLLVHYYICKVTHPYR